MFREKYCLLLIIIDYVAKLPPIIDIVAKNDRDDRALCLCYVFEIGFICTG